MSPAHQLAPALRDALAVLAACADEQDSFALTRDTVWSTVHDSSPDDHVAGALRLVTGLVGVSTLLLDELARSTGLTHQQVLHQLGTSVAQA
ncbi:hypothetical protein SAMN05660199_01122 [Klenkia soli]|uniref:Uncharacterized protein n=1 Tax=Klenkia soli TaxID=1052260 RepID=A0A1H0G3C2_9ACTN|nr:hypothetical protein [Klenkia soli]SDO01331.1 hypothetical protein SAMN05660199_01122 [Klenkia soli]